MSERDGAGVWRLQAHQWERIGAPLRPSPSDGAFLEAVAAEFLEPSILVLGVTPEMARLKWPPGTRLLALDHAQEMIERVWPGYPRPGEGAQYGDWLSAELPTSSYDLAVSDGCLGVLAFPDQHRALLQRLRGLLRASGKFVFRVFVRPQETEAAEHVFDAALHGEMGSFHAFKLRLLMAAQGETEGGVCVGDVWDLWQQLGPGAEALSQATGWQPEQIATIEAYRGQDTIYWFPTQQEVRASLREAGFRELACHLPIYELGARCPTFVCAPYSE